MSITNLLVKTYSLTSKTGLFDLPLVRGPFCLAYFWYKRYLEDPFYPILKKYPRLLGNGVIIDIGANIGYTATLFSEFSSREQVIHAFEPEPKNFMELGRVLRSKGLASRILAHRLALGETERNCSLWQADTHHADHRVVTESFCQQRDLSQSASISGFAEVEMRSLDDFAKEHELLDRISFVKMDVQGYEIPVLRGMKEVFQSSPGLVLAVEYCPKDLQSLGFQPELLISELAALGLQIYFFHDGDLRALDNLLLEDVIRERGYSDLVCIPGRLGSYVASHETAH